MTEERAVSGFVVVLLLNPSKGLKREKWFYF